jgi:hypothetical protein
MHDVVPAVELEADARIVAHPLEAEFLVDGYGIGCVRRDHRQHLPEAEGFRLDQQLGQQQPPQAAAGLAGVEID